MFVTSVTFSDAVGGQLELTASEVGRDWHAGLSAAQLTAQNMDKSVLLRSLIATQLRGQWQQLLAELEVAFASFLYGQSLEGAH